MLQLLCIRFSNISLQQNKEHVCKDIFGLLATAWNFGLAVQKHFANIRANCREQIVSS
jgi:hypothetical protein